MGTCCCSGRMNYPNSLHHGLTIHDHSDDGDAGDQPQHIDLNINDNVIVQNAQAPAQISQNAEDTSSGVDHPNRVAMARRKNLKSYLTQVRRSKQQLVSKKKKLEQMLLDKRDIRMCSEQSNATLFAQPFKHLSAQTTFPEICFTEWIIHEGVRLSEIANDVFNTPSSCDLSIGFIPEEICTCVMSYTLDLLPGVYCFEGTMDYNGTDDHALSAWDAHAAQSDDSATGNRCICQIVLNSRAEIVGGFFSENNFRYHITRGSYTYDTPHCLEFSKEYFNCHYKYKVYGRIERDRDHRLVLKGFWKLVDGNRGGNVRMRFVENDKGVQTHNVDPGFYAFSGFCNYLPNTRARRHALFTNRQKIQCLLTLNAAEFRVKGCVKFLSASYTDEFPRMYGVNNANGAVDDDEDVLSCVDEKESEWDLYGGLHISLANGYVMEGFFNGTDSFMGVWKNPQFVRFGHFEYSRVNMDGDCDGEREKQPNNQDAGVLMSESFNLQRTVSLDSDDQNDDEELDID